MLCYALRSQHYTQCSEAKWQQQQKRKCLWRVSTRTPPNTEPIISQTPTVRKACGAVPRDRDFGGCRYALKPQCPPRMSGSVCGVCTSINIILGYAHYAEFPHHKPQKNISFSIKTRHEFKVCECFSISQCIRVRYICEFRTTGIVNLNKGSAHCLDYRVRVSRINKCYRDDKTCVRLVRYYSITCEAIRCERSFTIGKNVSVCPSHTSVHNFPQLQHIQNNNNNNDDADQNIDKSTSNNNNLTHISSGPLLVGHQQRLMLRANTDTYYLLTTYLHNSVPCLLCDGLTIEIGAYKYITRIHYY